MARPSPWRLPLPVRLASRRWKRSNIRGCRGVHGRWNRHDAMGHRQAAFFQRRFQVRLTGG
ncbi:hypothetical protein GN316_05680 [Xylophilus sp. Kf1]|nr:hypothetical protein [Xylophilus sp. Kf1]